ncbi:MAG: T9SS type A sorting domain-containing protein, partial [Bacteroidota bacterium]
TRGTKVCRTFKEASFLSANQNIIKEIDAGPKIVTYAGSPFGGVITTIEQTAETAFDIGLQEKIAQSHELEWCTTLNTTYATSSGDDILYEDADIFVGAAINLEISSTERLSVDPDNCEFTESRGNRILPTEIGTDYVFSRWQIETDVIPSLLEVGDTSSAQSWERILAEEARAKANATLKRNYSFDGIASVSESETTSKDTDNSYQFDLTVTEDLKTVVGTEVGDVGSKISLSLAFGQGLTLGGSESESESTTVQYTLADDDPNDNFTVDILEDGVYNTPVFLLRAGESMCPWEPGTRNREQVGFNIDKLSEINVPESEAAVFRLQLTNEGQTGNDALIYTLGIVEDANPDGAVIQVNGSSLNSPRSFQILPDEELEVLLTVKKGAADVFNYPDLGIFMSSKCMLDHSRSLGYDLSRTMPEIDPETGEEITTEGPYLREDLAKFYKEFRLNVEFIEPCTPIDISFPRQDWVVTPADNERLSVTLTGYNNQDPDLDTVRLQYRPTGGDGSWINIQELGVADFADNPVAKVLQWDMEELRDGPYDIRATAVCKDLNLEPGISEVIRGRKETQPPRLLGTPQPADGILNPGDEISITFTKRIQCGLIFQADGIGTNININNLALIDKTTGELIDATISCRDDKIVVVPNVANQFIENRTLGVVVNDIQDFYGNPSDSIFWEFLVNRSNLYWDGGQIDEVTPEGESLTVTREIRNQSGAITSFDIPSVPDWVDVFPRTGTLSPGASQVINFVFPANLLADAYSTEIIMRTVDGEEPLPVNLRVACEGPAWSVNPADYSFSMNLTVELDIEGTLSEDRLDQIGAFINGELRGVANIQRQDPLATGPGNNPYLAFLTVYGDEVDESTVTFQIWDASDCNLYGETVESFPFRPDTVIGEPLQPQTIHTSGLLLKTIRLNEGWNWISYNLALPDSSVNATMTTLTQSDENSILKGQAQFSQYTPSANAWFGSLMETTTRSMFQYRSPAVDSLQLVGRVINPTAPLDLVVGWNWIGYLPNRGLPVNTALANLAEDEVLRNGDIIKSQATFAQYVAGLGWVGNLRFMSSPNGYQLRLTEPATLVYPDPANSLVAGGDQAVPKSNDSLYSPWPSINPAAYEFSMNLVAVVADAEGSLLLAEGDQVGAFVGTELRGAEHVIPLPELGAHLVFLTVFGKEEAERITFRYYDLSEDSEFELTDTLAFASNQVLGKVQQPVILSLATTTSVAYGPTTVSTFTAFPNPTSGQVYFDFTTQSRRSLRLTIFDPLGREVDHIALDTPASQNRLEWNVDQLPSGVYLVTIEQDGRRRSLRLAIK